ncbi:hypothetical protein BH11ACT7_BH11ACT7_03010 [soil metagenome]
MPWWGAVVIAVSAAIIGFAFDAGSGNKELTSAFAALYFLGCVAAVLAVRQNGIFTAVVQPPLILFIAVPGAYFLFHQSEINGIKDILINCGYPLIERFVLMLTTSVVVLVLGAARWYFGKSAPAADEAEAEVAAAPTPGLRAKLSSLFGGGAVDDEDDTTLGKQDADRPAATSRRSSRRPTSGSPKRPPPTRSRHARPPTDDLDDVAPPRRRRPAASGEDAEPRRRPRPTREPREPRDPGLRNPSREYRYRERDREPREREPYERPRRRPNPYETYDPAETFDAPPRPRRPAAGGGSGTGSTHHPVSRVRYRGSDDGDDRVEHRTRPRSRARHSLDSDRWPD